MHADRFAHIIGAGAVQTEPNAGLIEMGVETVRLPEGADVKLDSSINELCSACQRSADTGC